MFCSLKKHSMTKTDILCYDLHVYTCYCSCNVHISSLLLWWWCFACIMTYPLCMPHDLATANRHDHAWTENWAPNIWMLCTALSPMRPWYEHRQGNRRNHLYGTEGTWINCPTCFPLLNVGFMAILRRTDCFILIWTCNAALAVSRHCHFSKLSRLKIETDNKQERSFVLLHVVLENDVCWAAW